MIKCHIYTRSLVKDEKNRKRDTLFLNISNVYNKKMQWKWNKRCFMSSFSYNSKKHIYSAIAAWFFKIIKQTLMRSKCKMLYTVLEIFVIWSWHFYCKLWIQENFQAISKCWVKFEKLMQCMLSLSLSHFLDIISQQIIAMH